MEFMSALQTGHDDLKPSLFELLSESQLNALLPPSLRYLLALATHRHPRYLIRILNSFDEVYALLQLLVERHYLRTYAASFTEHFYGLKRERVLRVKGSELPRAQLATSEHVRDALHLRTPDVWRNLAIVVGIPYLKRKLDESYEIHGASANLLGRRNTSPPPTTLRARIFALYKTFLRTCYPTLNCAYYMSLLAYNLGYLFNTTKFASPFLALIHTRIRRLSPADHKAFEVLAHTPPAAAARPGQTAWHPRTAARTIGPRLLGGLRLLLPVSIFVLKFLEWWHVSDFARQLARKASEGLELPPPVVAGLPKKSSVALGGKSEGGDAEKEKEKALRRDPPIAAGSLLPILTVAPPGPATSALCPICLGPVVNATAAPSGYVYCYACIHRCGCFETGGCLERAWCCIGGVVF
ncbi:hypothetical protein EJ06DRAFT_12426 [Trichodelitschia bisporula]|uniref:Peroxisome assembly protein 12 n=1 Tax=Trichodelitschia bisporula TaxID=703511 RepID=A0A6G1IAG3_9PEZI|nr:hypothetical protein EJ06DRAFT_12426 [Trichodelitschia bisporula]